MEETRSDDPGIDLSRIQDTSEGDQTFERELFQVYLEDCSERIERLHTALKAQDLDTLRRDAHTIKGSSANVGTTHLHSLARALEAADLTDTDGTASALIAQIEAEFVRVKAAIDAYLAQ